MPYGYPPNNAVDLSWLDEGIYLYPSSTTTVNLTWEPKVPIVKIDVSGVYTSLEFLPLSGVVSNWSTPFTVTSNATLSAITITDEMNFYQGIEITSTNVNFSGIIISGIISLTPAILSDAVLDNISVSSVIDVGNLINGVRKAFTDIKIDCQVLVIPKVYDANLSFDSNAITIDCTLIALVKELKQHMEFSDGIKYHSGKIRFGFPTANKILEAYEISNNRTLFIPRVPEDPAYAVFLRTTDYNLTNEELRRGTLDLEMEFDHDIKDIEKINVWVMGPDGHAYKDKMRFFDFAGGTYLDHILYDPFKDTTVLRIPVHCINKKEYQFYIEVEYKASQNGAHDSRVRTMNEKERYLIPFQPHFETINPYVNIGDSLVFSTRASENLSYSSVFDSPQTTTRVFEDLNTGISEGASINIWQTNEFFNQTRIFYSVEETDLLSEGASNNIYFIQEYINLSIGQIGG
jgi:hypothetical protein